MKFKLIANWEKKDLKCYVCGSTQSVKYEVEIRDTEPDSKPHMVCMCNKCGLRRIRHGFN